MKEACLGLADVKKKINKTDEGKVEARKFRMFVERRSLSAKNAKRGVAWRCVKPHYHHLNDPHRHHLSCSDTLFGSYLRYAKMGRTDRRRSLGGTR